MDYILKAKNKAAQFFNELDLFPDLTVNFDLDFYNVDNIDKLKVPVSIDLDLPFSDNNISVIGYDPTSGSFNTVPDEAFDFELLLNNQMVLRGNLYIESVFFNNTIPTFKIRLTDKLQEIFTQARELKFEDLYVDQNSSVTFDQLMLGAEGSIGSFTTRDIVFPYIDMCNDTRKFGFASRQFIQYGYDQERVGLLPSFNVSNFIERFFTEAGVDVTSRLFQLGNYGTEVSNFSPDNLYMTLPSRIGASGDRNDQRTFLLREGRYNWYISDLTEDAEAGVSTARELPNYPPITIGWNHSSTATSLDGKFGYIKRDSFPNSYTDINKAFFAPHMSFNAAPTGSARTLPSGHWVALDIPMVSLTSTNFAKVVDIDAANSTAILRCQAVVWKDGAKFELFDMMDPTTNEPKEFNVSDATVRTTIDNVLFEGAYQGGFTQIQDYNHNTVLEFDDQAIGSFYWEDKDVTFDAGSTYSYSVEFQIVSGNIRVEHALDYIADPANTGYVIANNTATADFKSFQIAKAIFREKTSNVGQLYISFQETGNSNPYFGDDVINLYNSFRDNISLKPYDIVKQIISRFNLSVVYDQNTNAVLLDRLPDIREPNSSLDLNNVTDDAQEISIDISKQSLRSLKYTGPQGLFFDEYGYGEKIFNKFGNEDLSFNLSTRIYNRSLCGDIVTLEDLPVGTDEYEIGLTDNQFTPNSDIGIVLSYIDNAQYSTNIKRSKFVVRTDYTGIIYKTYKSHIFNGRLVGSLDGSLDLNYFDTVGDTTDLYDFTVANDNITFLSKPSMSFKALMPNQYAFNIKDNYSIANFDYIHNNQIVIKSVKGQSYDQGIYADIEAIIL